MEFGPTTRKIFEISELRVSTRQVCMKPETRLRRVARDVAGRLDRAITLGVASAYPVVFNMPTPDPVPDWKRVVRVSWRIVRATAVETVRILTSGRWE